MGEGGSVVEDDEEEERGRLGREREVAWRMMKRRREEG